MSVLKQAHTNQLLASIPNSVQRAHVGCLKLAAERMFTSWKCATPTCRCSRPEEPVVKHEPEIPCHPRNLPLALSLLYVRAISENLPNYLTKNSTSTVSLYPGGFQNQLRTRNTWGALASSKASL